MPKKMPKTTNNLRFDFSLFKKAIMVCLIFIVSIIATILIYLNSQVHIPTNIVELKSGSISNIISQLREKGFNLNKIDSRILSLYGVPKSGYIQVASDSNITLSRHELFQNLIKAQSVQINLTLIPGETSYFLLQDISQKFNLNLESLTKAYDEVFQMDGWLLPETYSLPLGLDEKGIINMLKSLSDKEQKNLSLKLLGKYDKKEWIKILSKASVIQKESASVEEMPLVSAVIDNRIKANMPLQMDGSLNYGKYSHIKITPERIRNDKTHFNTYRHKGIPPSPVGSTSIESIRAAISPASVDYLFFVRNKSGKHTFTKTYKEHMDNF